MKKIKEYIMRNVLFLPLVLAGALPPVLFYTCRHIEAQRSMLALERCAMKGDPYAWDECVSFTVQRRSVLENVLDTYGLLGAAGTKHGQPFAEYPPARLIHIEAGPGELPRTIGPPNPRRGDNRIRRNL